MKKWIACLLAAVMLLSLTACSDFIAGIESGMQDAAQNAGEELNKSVTPGVVSGDKYTSAYSGLSFTKNANWRFLTDKEHSDAMNAGSEILDQDSFEQALATMATVYDMMVMDDTTGNNVIVSYENLELSNSTSITLEAYMNAVEKQLTAQSGISVTIGEKKTVTLSGNSYYRTECTMVYSGITMSQFYYVRKLDKYMNGIIITVVDGTDISAIEAMFNK